MHLINCTKKQEITTYYEEKNQSDKTDPELTEMLELADKDFRKLLYCISYVQKVKCNIEHDK